MHVYLNGEDMGIAASNIPKVSYQTFNYCLKCLSFGVK